MSARAAGWVLFAVYLVAMFALQMVVAHVYGLGWQIALLPVEMAGGFAGGTLIGKAATR